MQFEVMGTKKNQSAGPQQMKKIQGTDFTATSMLSQLLVQFELKSDSSSGLMSLFEAYLKKCHPLFINLGAYKFRHCGLSNDMRVDWRGRI